MQYQPFLHFQYVLEPNSFHNHQEILPTYNKFKICFCLSLNKYNTFLQFSSSDLSRQSAFKSHLYINGMQVPSVQVNWSSLQDVNVSQVFESDKSHFLSSKSHCFLPIGYSTFVSSSKEPFVLYRKCSKFQWVPFYEINLLNDI